jgi:hypothetical protein
VTKFREFTADDQELAAAWAEAGVMPVARYVELARQFGWASRIKDEQQEQPASPKPPTKPD